MSSTRIENFRCTWSGFLQCVPAVEGPFLLLAQVGAMLQQPMGDPALADAWKAARHRITTECFASGPSPICRQPLEEFKRHKGIQEGKMFSLSLALNLFLLQSLVSYATWSQWNTAGPFNLLPLVANNLLNSTSGFDWYEFKKSSHLWILDRLDTASINSSRKIWHFVAVVREKPLQYLQ